MSIEANTIALAKSKEECKRLNEALQKATKDLKIQLEEVHRKQFKINNLERMAVQLKSKLSSQEVNLAHAMDVIRTTVKITSTKEIDDRIMEGTITIQHMKALQE